jgi:hypothetical protein
MNPPSNIILIFNNCVKITSEVILTQFIYRVSFNAPRYPTFFMPPSCVKLTTVVSLTQLNGMEQMEIDAMGSIRRGLTNMLSSLKLKQKASVLRLNKKK